MEPITMGIAGATALAALIEYLTKNKEKGGVLTGTEAQFRNAATPEQQQAQNQLLQQLGPLLQQIGTQPQGNFQDIANAEVNRFNTQTIPSLAERFTALGAGGVQSSGFRGALGSAGAGLAQNLASLGAQYGLQQRGQNMDLLRLLMTGGMQQTRGWQEREPGLIESTAKAVLPMATAYYGGAGSGDGSTALTNYLSGTGNSGKLNALLQGQMGGTNDYVSNLLANRPMSSQDFFKSSGLMRG